MSQGFADRLKQLRKQRDLSRAQLAACRRASIFLVSATSAAAKVDFSLDPLLQQAGR